MSDPLTEPERELVLTALWQYQRALADASAASLPEAAKAGMLRRMEDLGVVVAKLGGDPGVPFFGLGLR